MRPLPLPTEGSPVPDRPKSRTDGLVRSVRSAVLLAVSLASLEGCVVVRAVRSPQQNAMAAYEEGRYLEAKALYASADPSKMIEEDRDQIKDINWMIEGLIGQFMKEASAEKQKGNYVEAIRNFEYALLYTPPDHPNRKVAEKGIADLRANLVSFEKEYETLKKTLGGWLETRKVDDEKLMADLNAAFTRLRALRPILKKADKGPNGPYNLFLGFSREFYTAGDYANADEMAKHAEVLDLQVGNYTEESEITPANARLIAHIRVYNTTMSKQNRMVRIVQGMQKALAEKRYDEVRKLAAVADRVEPANQFVASIMEETDRLSPKKAPPVQDSKGSSKEAAAAKKRAKEAEEKATKDADQATKDADAKAKKVAEAQQLVVNGLLKQAQDNYEAKKLSEAFVGIDKAIIDWQGKTDVTNLIEQRKLWEERREKFIASLTKTADSLYLERKKNGEENRKRASDLYREILSVDPKNQNALNHLDVLNQVQPLPQGQ